TGYPCAYQYNISWASETLSLAPEPDPGVVFEKLFGSRDDQRLKERIERRKSVLDFVMDDVESLNRKLGRNDREKVDQYLDGVRKIEKQIEKAEQFKTPDAALEHPGGIPEKHEEHVDLMYDLMAYPFQTD